MLCFTAAYPTAASYGHFHQILAQQALATIMPTSSTTAQKEGDLLAQFLSLSWIIQQTLREIRFFFQTTFIKLKLCLMMICCVMN
jgi:hypothetical protein